MNNIILAIRFIILRIGGIDKTVVGKDNPLTQPSASSSASDVSLMDLFYKFIDEQTGNVLYRIVAKLYATILDIRGQFRNLSAVLKIDYAGTVGDEPVPDAIAYKGVMEIYDILTPLAIVFLIIWFLIEMTKVYAFQRDEMTLQSALAPLMKFIVGYALIAYGKRFIEMTLNLNNVLIDTIVNLNTTNGKVTFYDEVTLTEPQKEALSQIVSNVTDLGWMGAIGSLATGLIIEVAVTIATGMIIFHCYSRKLEIMVRLPFVGLALSDIYEGKQSTGVRYLKKLLALAISGLAIMVLLNVGTDLMAGQGLTSPVGKPLAEIISPVLIAFAMSGMVSVAKQITNDVLGV